MPNLYCLDTNVLLSDTNCIHKFQEHTVYIPFIVLEELDKHKKGLTDLARAAREVTRNLEKVIKECKSTPSGYELPNGGHLQFTTQQTKENVAAEKTNDNIIINEVRYIKDVFTKKPLLRVGIFERVILVSSDINMRVKATALGIENEDYESDNVVEKDSDVIGFGYVVGDALFSENTKSRLIQTFNKNSDESIAVPYIGSELDPFTIGGYVVVANTAQFKVVDQDEVSVTLVPLHVYSGKHNVWGIRAKNVEQNIALNMLMDKEKDLVCMSGQAGSGKTLLTLAASLEQVIEDKTYERIIFLRETVTAAGANEVGFLPGTLDQKMMPFLGALTENLKQLTGFAETPKHSKKQSSNEQPMNPLGQFENVIEVNSIGLMRGTSIPKSLIIIDEAQNLTKDMIKMLLTRAGEGSKIVMLGNINQIDSPYLSKYNNGMSITIEKFNGCDLFSYVVLQQTVRSRLAEEAVNRLNG